MDPVLSMDWDAIRTMVVEEFDDEEGSDAIMVLEVVVGARLAYADGGEQIVTCRSDGSRIVASALGRAIAEDYWPSNMTTND